MHTPPKFSIKGCQPHPCAHFLVGCGLGHIMHHHIFCRFSPSISFELEKIITSYLICLPDLVAAAVTCQGE